MAILKIGFISAMALFVCFCGFIVYKLIVDLIDLLRE
jgi:hypothetical protein